MSAKPPDPKTAIPKKERLAKALRENLKRRKAAKPQAPNPQAPNLQTQPPADPKDQ